MTQWLKYKHTIPVVKLQKLCELAAELDEAKEVVQNGIGQGYVYPRDFVRTKDLFERLVHSLIATVRSFAGDKLKEEVEKFEKELNNMLQWSERDNREIAGELKGVKRNYAFMNLYLSRINKLLYAFFSGALDDALMYNKIVIMREFVLSIYQRCGVTPSPKFLEEMKDKGKPLEAEE